MEAADWEKGEVQRGWTEWLRTRRDPGMTAEGSGSQVVRSRRGGQARARKGWRRSVGALGRHEKVKQRIEFLKKADAILQRGVGMQWWFRVWSGWVRWHREVKKVAMGAIRDDMRAGHAIAWTTLGWERMAGLIMPR